VKSLRFRKLVRGAACTRRGLDGREINYVARSGARSAEAYLMRRATLSRTADTPHQGRDGDPSLCEKTQYLCPRNKPKALITINDNWTIS
jgi:hypothetical protein